MCLTGPCTVQQALCSTWLAANADKGPISSLVYLTTFQFLNSKQQTKFKN